MKSVYQAQPSRVFGKGSVWLPAWLQPGASYPRVEAAGMGPEGL